MQVIGQRAAFPQSKRPYETFQVQSSRHASLRVRMTCLHMPLWRAVAGIYSIVAPKPRRAYVLFAFCVVCALRTGAAEQLTRNSATSTVQAIVGGPLEAGN